MKYFFCILGFVFSFNVYSASCDKNGCTGKPRELFSNYYLTGWEDGRVYFHLKDNISKQFLDCNLAEGAYMTLMSSHPIFKEIYSSMLSASAMDRQLFVRIKNKTNNCEISYIRIYM